MGLPGHESRPRSGGRKLECCIFPQETGSPFIIDGATVRWINAREFGLSFTNVRPGVQKQLAQCAECVPCCGSAARRRDTETLRRSSSGYWELPTLRGEML